MAGPLLRADPSLRLSRCWDLAAAHRLLHGGSRDGPAHVWAAVRGLDPAGLVPPLEIRPDSTRVGTWDFH